MVLKILLIDSDFRRRAAISHRLEGPSCHIEPLEDAWELSFPLPDNGVLLLHDDGKTIGEVVKQMAENACWRPIICFSEDLEIKSIVGALRKGVDDYLPWPFTEQEISCAISIVADPFNSASIDRLREAKARSKVDKLTRREREVLSAVADGLSNRLIGDRLQISPRTVEIHRSNMLAKLGANHTSEAIRISVEASLSI